MVNCFRHKFTEQKGINREKWTAENGKTNKNAEWPKDTTCQQISTTTALQKINSLSHDSYQNNIINVTDIPVLRSKQLL